MSTSASTPAAPFRAAISGLGFYVPERRLHNRDLCLFLETSDEWIRSRTGIIERRIAATEETTADLAEAAARRALEDANLAPQDVQMIIVATCTPDYQFPSTASLLQHKLGAQCAAFDVGAACSGFVYALITAAQFIQSGAVENVLVVGAEVMSRVINWSDRATAILFGDGAGAAVVTRAQPGSGLLAFDMGSDGIGAPLLKLPIAREPEPAKLPGEYGGHDEPADSSLRVIFQNGREVYRFAVHVMGESALRALEKCRVAPSEVDLFVPHQANVRIIDAARKRLELPEEKVFVNVEKYGNTSAASVPIALCEARDQGLVRTGSTVVMVGFGAGLTWASAVVRW